MEFASAGTASAERIADGFKGAAEDEEGLKAQGRTQITRPAAFLRNTILIPVVDRVRKSAAVFVVRALEW